MCSANSMEHSYTQLRAGMVGGLNPIPTPPQPMQTSLWKCTPVNLCLLRNCWRACFYVITSESCFMCAEWLPYTLAVQNTLQQLGLHTVHNQSTPLRVEVMTSTHPAHPAFNLFFFLFYAELHIPWLLNARGTFGEWGKQLKLLQLIVAKDSRESTLHGPVSIHPFWRCSTVTSCVSWVLHLRVLNMTTSFVPSHSP